MMTLQAWILADKKQFLFKSPKKSGKKIPKFSLIFCKYIPTQIKYVQLRTWYWNLTNLSFRSYCLHISAFKHKIRKTFVNHILVVKKKIAAKASAQNSLMQNRSWLLSSLSKTKNGTLKDFQMSENQMANKNCHCFRG